MKYSLALIGAGNIGSRYLQGLARCRWYLKITVVDPCPQALLLAKERWKEANGHKTPHRIFFIQKIKTNDEYFDLAIITTSADIRLNIIKNLSQNKRVRYWILEKLLTQTPAHLDVIQELTADAEGVWVNTSLRMMSWHRFIYDQLSESDTLRVHVSDSLWGLASCAVHYLDLTMWWSREHLLEIDISKLNSEWLESKRDGFYELSGILKAHFSRGTNLILEARKEGNRRNLRVETDKACWNLDELNSVATDPTGTKTFGRIENQSEMTPRLIDSILESGRCELPSIQESIPIHRIFLQKMLMHWNLSNGYNHEKVPIT